ncbi:hypothetical protein, partial [Streptomyces africanus]|uniref:hypothetical protein n=1 Tax=Streptomyces africanus TaxID=231024 RepID=UPI001FCA3D06
MEQPNGHPCPECGTPRQPDNTPSCACTHRAAEALRNTRTTEAAAAEDFDPLRIRPYVELTPETVTAPSGDERTPRAPSAETQPTRTDAATRAAEAARHNRTDGPSTPAEAPGQPADAAEPWRSDAPAQPSPADAPARADVPTALWHAKAPGPKRPTGAPDGTPGRTHTDGPLPPTEPTRAPDGTPRPTHADGPLPPTEPTRAPDGTPRPTHADGLLSPTDPAQAAQGTPRQHLGQTPARGAVAGCLRLPARGPWARAVRPLVLAAGCRPAPVSAP